MLHSHSQKMNVSFCFETLSSHGSSSSQLIEILKFRIYNVLYFDFKYSASKCNFRNIHLPVKTEVREHALLTTQLGKLIKGTIDKEITKYK